MRRKSLILLAGCLCAALFSACQGAPAKETTPVQETTAAPETAAVQETTPARETTAAPETAAVQETPAVQETTAVPKTEEAPETGAQETTESKIYKALDKLEALIQHNESPLDTWSENEFELNKTYAFDTVAFSQWFVELRKAILEDTLKKIDENK